ncbi:tripartite tricarboxylate transporter TctB family protein [Salinicola endophyticus]|uniref:Tripartite tricarboxylate transporter TctB family protein n=1 Tax=Salinicola endophyticus TaxID=1949083 RepID=A0ABY8FMT9_9GAMM|nr:tripartite tricarboxylate transporter TctB family protein [Salinicola endophyticus]WFF42026.1 tripartite tricarboxylate transporter TctB family protein [Salinicola endophyticus]
MSVEPPSPTAHGTSRHGLQTLICSAILGLAACGLLTLQAQVTVFDFGDPGPDARFFPRLVLWLLILVAALRLWRHRRTPDSALGAAAGWARALAAMLLVAAAIAAMNTLGFIVSVAAVGIVLAWLLGERRLRFSVLLPLVVALAIAWVARHGLHLPLP